MIDIGVNLTSSQFAGEQADLVARARAAGVEALILTGTDLAGSRESAEQAAEWPGYCFSTAGVHPHDAKSVDEQTLPALRTLAALPQVVAIGECGLDYNRDFSPSGAGCGIRRPAGAGRRARDAGVSPLP